MWIDYTQNKSNTSTVDRMIFSPSKSIWIAHDTPTKKKNMWFHDNTKTYANSMFVCMCKCIYINIYISCIFMYVYLYIYVQLKVKYTCYICAMCIHKIYVHIHVHKWYPSQDPRVRYSHCLFGTHVFTFMSQRITMSIDIVSVSPSPLLLNT